MNRFLASLVAGCLVALPAAVAVTLQSPGGLVSAEITTTPEGALVYSVRAAGRLVIEPSRIGVTLDGTDIGGSVTLGEPQTGSLDERYPMLGPKAVATNRARTLRLPLEVGDAVSGTFTLEARAYDDGFAWRISASKGGRVTGEASSWTLPAGSRVFYFERDSNWKLMSYAGDWRSAPVEALPTVSKQGPVQGAPLVIERPDGGYALLTEAALYDYSGLRLRAVGGRRVQADFTEGKAGFVVDGKLLTPWRVTLVAPTLDALVNSDLIANLNPAPDPVLFADTSYLRPGRSVWRWWSRGTGTPEQERAFVDYAVALGFEYTLIDDGWKDWPDAWQRVAEICAYARGRGIGVLLWKDYKDVRAPAENWAQLRAFLDAARDAGIAGVKLDFMNAESKDRVDFQTAALRFAAERRLLVVFHGVQKPTGSSRTFPNELTREGIRGLELNKMKEGPITPAHNAALPFTRFVVGPGDYTPLGYSNPGPTTWAHQLATVVQFTSPLQVIAEYPGRLLEDEATRPGLDVLKAIPSTWDETRILPPSRIGEISVMARRNGDTWFLAILNGAHPTTLASLDLSFLGTARHQAVVLTSPRADAFHREELADVSAATRLGATLAAGDGLVAWFRPAHAAVPSGVYAPESALILTPPSPAAPRINGPAILGVRPGSPILYRLPVTGRRPMTLEASGLPSGVSFDQDSGQLHGRTTERGRHAITFTARNADGEVRREVVLQIGDTIALTPPLGWNSWNSWGKRIDADKVLATAKALVATGLADHGWSYVNIDDTWQGARGGRHQAILPNEKFPDLKALGDAVHAMGLKLGIYSTPWTQSYAGHIGGSSDRADGSWQRNPQGHHLGRHTFETQDVAQWVDWGVDYLKYDWYPNDVPSTRRMADALRAAPRDIVYSLSNSALLEHAADYAALANLWRTTGDIRDDWRLAEPKQNRQGIVNIWDQHLAWERHSGPGHWNDPDMLVVGQVGWGRELRPTRLTPDEQYSHLSLWCLWSAPLILGCPVERLDPFTLNLLTNDDVLAVDQDPLGRQGRTVARTGDGNLHVIAKPLADGSVALGLFNRGSAPAEVTARWSDLGISGPRAVRDLWRQRDLGQHDERFTARVAPHGVILLRLTQPQPSRSQTGST